MKVDIWGARGSVPSPGPETIRYGGNTSCVGITLSDGSLLALDAGTGIRNLGLALPADVSRVHILLTHLHLDHIQGLVFFEPLFRSQAEIVIWGPATPEASLRDRIARYISAPLSPVEVRELPCDLSFRTAPEELEIGSARISAAAVAHRGPTLGYRIEDAGTSLAYIPDHEPALGADLDALDPGWISGFGLAEGADLLVHDGQYADTEYPEHLGWGHSALSHSLTFARRSGARRTVLFHHDPLHSDAWLDDHAARAAAVWEERGGRPGQVELAREGATYEVDPATGEFAAVAAAAAEGAEVTAATAAVPAGASPAPGAAAVASP